MKMLKQILMVIMVLTVIISCKKDDKNSTLTLEIDTISAKWLVSGTSEYSSFEFNKSGNYIVIKNANTTNQQIKFGTYTITESTIILSDYGTIIVSEIKDNSITFIFKTSINPDTEINIVANKQEEMESTTKTDLLCRTWELLTFNGDPVAGTDMELTVLFSKAGTYFVTYNNEPDTENVAQWKWKNTEETELYYSWDEVPNWGTASYVQITELTSNSLIINENDVVYVLQPLTNTKSVNFNSVNKFSEKETKGIFFK
ncbi:MAG: hypothetical protein C0595_09330 [Marinilabiliales bacterium]|nr:MAG: hypothetical protein C0595_09330 [Marinilabiliales bacterium]